MRIRLAASFTAVLILACAVVCVFVLAPGLRIVGVFIPRQVWLVENGALWMAGLWLWLVGIFSWMWMLVTLLWSYSPAHRITTMLQSGLMLLGAGLAIAGTVTWMSVIPVVVELPDAHILTPITDALALGFLGAGCFMGGIATAWIGYDLARLNFLPAAWVAPMCLAGLCAIPAPFLLPHQPWLLAAGAVFWIAGTLHLGLRRNIPHAYTEWQ